MASALVPDQISERAAIATIKPLLEDAGVLKIGQNCKFDWQIFALRGVEITPFDDTMLMSYVLDAGRRAHGMDAMAEDWLDHRTIRYGEVAGTGKAKQSVATHRCSGCGSENYACCFPPGSKDVATKGMGMRFEVAPLK